MFDPLEGIKVYAEYTDIHGIEQRVHVGILPRKHLTIYHVSGMLGRLSDLTLES